MALKTYRAGVIGAGGKGDYGHALDTAFVDVPGVKVVAVADPDATSLQKAGKKLGVDRLYEDYREMLRKEELDYVAIGPRWVTERLSMVEAAAKAGCHIYCEKPFAGDLETADAMMAACKKAKVKIAVAHQFQAMPPVRKTLEDLRAGKFGKLLRMRARPKDDARGGGEDLIVHGTHLFDLMVAFAGHPRWVSAHLAVGKRDAVIGDARQGTEPLGPLAGDSLSAMYGFDEGVRGFFDTTVGLDQKGKTPYGLMLECEKAMLHIRGRGEVFIYDAPGHIPENGDLGWQRVWIQDWHFDPVHKPRKLDNYIDLGNKVLVADLLEAVAKDREPRTSGASALSALEMIQGVYASHFAGGIRLSIPLKTRKHPLQG